MVPAALSFVAGVLLLQYCAHLPPLWAVFSLIGAASILWFVTGVRFLFFLVAGLAWAWWQAASLLDARLPETLAGGQRVITGVVTGLPESRGNGQRFLFEVESVEAEPLDPIARDWRGKVRLSWKEAPSGLRAGQRLRLRVRLFRPDGWRNPGGFDRERWLYANAIMATGYVVGGDAGAELPDATGVIDFVDRLRGRLRDVLDAGSGTPRAKALLSALLIGDRSALDATQWESFRVTGTGHLVAISGLHIGLVAGVVLLLVGRIWRLSARLCTLWPARRAGAFVALIAAFGYAALAGFSVPTQRALLMLVLALGASMSGRAVAPSGLLAGALLIVVVVDTTAVLSAGAWLSFGAVAMILLMTSGRYRQRSATGNWWRIQWGLALGLAPLVAAWGLPISVISPLVNLIAVPWFTLVLVPLALLSAVLAGWTGTLGSSLLEVALRLAELTQAALQTAAAWGRGWYWHPPTGSPGLWGLALAGGAVALAPLSLRHRLLGLAMMIPLGFPPDAGVTEGALRIAVLDVGQGLAVVAMTSSRTLVYDLGPRWNQDGGAATAVVIPFLESQGVRKVDRLILSHDDSDHAGAWRAFVRGFEVGDVVAGQADRHGPPARPCRSGESWSWESTNFELVHLDDGRGSLDDNDASCILWLRHGETTLLLGGDISARAERRLLDEYPWLFPVDLVQVPHHGSKTSSSPAFVEATRAASALVSAGYRNRYGFPVPEIADRWAASGARVLNTAESGALIIDVPLEGEPEVRGFREMARRYWHR